MPALNYTTTVPADRTVGECQSILAKSGAASVHVAYSDGRATGLGFTLTTPHGQRQFTLPVDIDAMHRLLTAQARDGAWRRAKMSQAKFTSREHAERVAWRVTKDWLEANCALIAAQMATIDMVMLPFLHVDPAHTLYEAYKAREQAALEAGSP